MIIGAQLLHGLTFGGLYVVSVSYLSEAVDEDLKGAGLKPVFYKLRYSPLPWELFLRLPRR